MNFYKEDNKTYEYYIYLPECNNMEYTILSRSLNEDKSDKDKERLSKLFIVKTNKYYFEIINRPDNYGYFLLNNHKISEKNHIENNDYIIDFIVTNQEIMFRLKMELPIQRYAK